MATSAGHSEILTIREVAEYLKVTDRTIYRLAAAKRIPAFKVGGTWRFSRADIDVWIRRHRAWTEGEARGGAANGPTYRRCRTQTARCAAELERRETSK